MYTCLLSLKQPLIVVPQFKVIDLYKHVYVHSAFKIIHIYIHVCCLSSNLSYSYIWMSYFSTCCLDALLRRQSFRTSGVYAFNIQQISYMEFVTFWLKYGQVCLESSSVK